MKALVSEEQLSFFKKNGYIAFAIEHPSFAVSEKRDGYRNDPILQKFLLQTIAPIARMLMGKSKFRLGLSQWITEKNRPKKSLPLSKMFCIQGLCLGVAISNHISSHQSVPSLGISPMPSEGANLLFFWPHFLLDWNPIHSDLLIVAFAKEAAVFIHNPEDKQADFLKTLGYSLGDTLKNATHPLIL